MPETEHAIQPVRPADSDEAVIAVWLRSLPDSAKTYAPDIERWRNWTGYKALAAVTLADLQAYQDYLQTTGRKPGTRNKLISTVKSLLTFCERSGYLRYNVGAALKRERDNRQGVPPPDEAAMWRMIDNARSPRNGILLWLLFVSGVRVAELTGLRWEHLQPNSSGGVLYVENGKRGKSRYIPLPADLWRLIVAWRDVCNAQPAAPVFPIGEHRVWAIVKAEAARAGLACWPHLIRHAHIQAALDAGVPQYVVQQTVGHSRGDTTAAYAAKRPTQGSSLIFVHPE